MSDVKRVTLTTISDVVKKGSGGGAGGGASIGGPFGALSFDGANAMGSAFGGGGSAFAGKESSAGSSGAAGPDGGKSGGTKKPKTVRLELNLFEPTAESFPEFNFSKLVHEEQKRLKKAQKKQHDDANNGFLSDPELDNDVARMARELERKYGSGTAYASKDKCARPAKLDYCDRGAGYDEDDSFIDNSEAYDELIPQEVETVGGGFYINSGQLEFKQLSNFERPDDVHRMPKPKKRALSTTSESSDDDEPPANAKKKAEETRPPLGAAAAAATPSQSSSEKPATANPEPPLQQQQLTEEERVNAAGSGGAPEVTSTGDEKVRVNGHVAKKQKLTDNGPLGAPKEKDKAKSSTGTKAPQEDGAGGKEKTNGVKAKVSGVSTQPTPVVVGATPVASGTGPGKKDENENDGGVKLIKTTTVKDMLRAKRDSLRKMEQEKKGRSSGSSRVSSSEAEEDGDGGGDEDEEDEENDEDDEEDEEEDDEDEEMGEGSDKESNESGSDEDIGTDSESSHESTSEKDAAARAKVVTVTNGTTEGGEEGQRPVTAVPTEHQQQQKDNEKEKEKERKRKESKLPDEMPEALRKAVEALKELAQTHAIGGKLNYFDSKVAEVLLQVDEGARAAGNSTRNAIFRHLEAQLSISRQSLQLKIKKIRIRKLEGRAKTALDQLEDTICDQMPLLLAKHELECRKVAEQRAVQASAAATAAAAAAAGSNVLPSGGSSDPVPVNGEKPGPQTNSNTAPSTPQIRNPKKKFPWSERTRDLLWELYSIRVESFALVRPRNETEDDFVAEYLRNKVVPLWPKGWIRYEDLHKELDRRKKVLAKSAPAAAVGGPVPKKHPLVVLPPLTSPLSSTVDPTWMTSSGTSTTAMNGSTKATGTPSAGGGGAGKSGSSPGATAAAPLTSSQVPGNLSPNGVSHKRGSSDHSITNIMNSPPLPPPATGRHSFDDDQLMLSPPTPTGSAERDGSSAKRPILVSTPEHHRTSLPVPDRQRWNSREDDSDSSIEIIGEYNFIGGGGAGGHVPTAGAGVIHSAKSAIVQSAPQTPASSPNVLPVLNKEKYKNLIAGKNKGHGSGAGGNSPVGSMDNTPTGGVLVGPGKYSKHSPTTAAGERMTPQQQGPGGGGGGGGSLSFTTPTGSTASTGGGGGIRLSDVSRMKESPSAPTIDLDVHQIMKDLKEFQELQQHHSAGSSRKSDATTIPSQQQHDRSQKSKNAPIVVD